MSWTTLSFQPGGHYHIYICIFFHFLARWPFHLLLFLFLFLVVVVVVEYKQRIKTMYILNFRVELCCNSIYYVLDKCNELMYCSFNYIRVFSDFALAHFICDIMVTSSFIIIPLNFFSICIRRNIKALHKKGELI